MKLELMYPRIIPYVLIACFAILFVWRKKSRFKKGVIVANTKYVKSMKYYKQIMLRYRVYNILIKIVCILLIFIATILTSRLYVTKNHQEEFNNRDIVLCMDVSGSVKPLNQEITKTLKNIVSKLKDERFGIAAFNSSPVTLLPLTTDYNYALSSLDTIINDLNDNSKSEYSKFYSIGTTNSNRGTSLIGDGLAYCASTFNKDDNRTKIVILTTDDQVAGKQIITVKEAAEYCKVNDVKVYPIGTTTVRDIDRQELTEIANITGGAYYDFKDFSTDDIAQKIEALNKSAIVRNVYTTQLDLPELVFPYLLYIVPILCILDWRVKI